MYKSEDKKVTLATNLKLYCETNNLTHKDLEALLGVSSATLNNWLTLKSEPDPKRQKLLEKVFHASFDKICSHIVTARLMIDKPISIEDIFPYNFIISAIQGYNGGTNAINDYEEYPLRELDMDYRSISPVDFYSVFTTQLTDREQLVVHYRYRDGLTLDATSNRIGLTRERIRQIEYKAGRKTKRGLIQIIASRPKLEELKAENDQLRMYIVSLQNMSSGEQPEPPFEITHPTLDTPIEDLDFSVRTYNCLKRAQINTVKDIVNYEESFLRVRNLGRRSVVEIVDKIEGMHIGYEYDYDTNHFVLSSPSELPAYPIKEHDD